MAGCSLKGCPNRAHYQVAMSIAPQGLIGLVQPSRFALNLGVCRDHGVQLLPSDVLQGDIWKRVRDGFTRQHNLEPDIHSAKLELVRMAY